MKCHFIFHGGRFKIQVSKELPELFVSTFSDTEHFILMLSNFTLRIIFHKLRTLCSRSGGMSQSESNSVR